jgi:hypothetical protein
MSIIYDALKKAEGNSAGIFSKDNQPKEKKSNQNKVKLTILIFLFLGVAAILVFNFSSQKQVSSKQTIIEPKQENKQNTILKKEIKKPEAKLNNSNYRLEGIIFDQDNPFAVINGKRVYQGDKIGSYIVLGINKNSVELSEKGSEKSKVLSISF